MSRLRRPFLYDRYIFVTVNLLKLRTQLQASVARTCFVGPRLLCSGPEVPRTLNGRSALRLLARSVAKMREKHGFVLTAWVFLPDHWHAIIYPPCPLTISTVLKAVKVSSMISINQGRRQSGELWQGRFFDRALRAVKEYHETVDYIHLNPVRRRLVRRAEDWKWSSAHEYAGVGGEEQERRCGLKIDRIRLPVDENTTI